MRTTTASAILLLTMLTGCATPTTTTTGSDQAPVAEPTVAPPDPTERLGRWCPSSAPDPTGLLETAQVPPGTVGGPGLLCRYETVDGSLAREGGMLLEPAQVAALRRAYEQRSLGSVDCQPTPTRPVWLVLDLDEQGRPGAVVVDETLCGTVEAGVGGEATYGLATQEHLALLREVWASR